MIGSPIATAVGGASVAPQVDDESYELTDSVDAWERSAIPLRANTDDATTVVQTPNIIYNQNGTETQSDISSVGVFKPNTDIRFNFKDRAGAPIADLDLNASTTQVHTVRLDEDVNSSNFDSDDAPDTVDELRDRLNKEDVNSNATFENITSKVPSDYSGGALSFTHQFSDSGMYAVMVTKTNGNGIVVDDSTGNLSEIDGEVLIGGVETVAVQQGNDADAGAPGRTRPGNTLEFTPTANLDTDSDVNHVVAVYREDTVTSDTVTIETPENIDNETNLSEVTVSSDIGFVSGVSDVPDDVTLLGRTLEARNDTGRFSFDTIVSRIATEANTSEPTVDDGETILNASATGVVGEDSATVNVETLDTWNRGTYHYVYIASGEDSTEFVTDTGTVSIRNPRNNNGGGGGGAAPPTTDPPTLPDEEDETDDGDTDEEAPDVEEVREDLQQTEPNTRVSSPITDSDPDRPGVTVRPEGTESVREITFSNEDASGNVDISEWQDPPETVGQSIRATVVEETEGTTDSRNVRVPVVADITPDSEEVRGSPATVTMTVDSDQIENPEDVVITHESGNSWETLETSVEETSDGEIELTAETDSFSLFAVAETTETSQTDDGEEPVDETGSGPGPAVIIGVLVVLALIAAVAFAYSNQQSDDNEL
jgi:PGF-pre-PGF domain-containing protein